MQAAFDHKILRHICNSAGIEHFPERQLDMCRLGLGLYGINQWKNPGMSNIKLTFYILVFGLLTMFVYSFISAYDLETCVDELPRIEYTYGTIKYSK